VRRALVTTMTALVALGLWAPSASAGTIGGGGGLRFRYDGDDSSSLLDIYAVGTALSRRKAFFSVTSWDQIQASDLNAQNNSFYLVKLDTQRRGRADRFLYLYYWPNNGRFYCDIYDRAGQRIGYRDNAQFDGVSIYCAIRRRWLGLEKEPRFAVEAWSFGNFVDRAPNLRQGRWRGL
jgi:hypothetical protein